MLYIIDTHPDLTANGQNKSRSGYSRFALGTARRRQLQHLRHVGVDQEERILVDGTLPHQYQVGFGDRIETAFGDFALATAETGTRVVLE